MFCFRLCNTRIAAFSWDCDAVRHPLAILSIRRFLCVYVVLCCAFMYSFTSSVPFDVTPSPQSNTNLSCNTCSARNHIASQPSRQPLSSSPPTLPLSRSLAFAALVPRLPLLLLLFLTHLRPCVQSPRRTPHLLSGLIQCPPLTTPPIPLLLLLMLSAVRLSRLLFLPPFPTLLLLLLRILLAKTSIMLLMLRHLLFSMGLTLAPITKMTTSMNQAVPEC